MPTTLLFSVLADTVLVIHVLFIAFVIFGLVAVYVGYFLDWQWVRNRVFRFIHLGAIGVVVVQTWIGVICPLTTWEMALREKAGEATYSGSFIQHWLHNLIYFNPPDWVFTLVYTAFAALVLASWFVVRPRTRNG
ncbi:DUF2784 family protein [Halomonas alkaliantarctica]|nr:DUF2784 family protein [Halomonas alkaliantarctica]